MNRPKSRVPFEPRRYLDEYFGAADSEYEGLFRFWCSAVAAMPRGRRAVELGVGPTLYSAACLVDRFEEVHLADYVPASLVEIRRWLGREPGCFDWRPFVALILRTEGRDAGPEAVAAREARMRAAITRVVECDLRQEPPLPALDGPYDLVTAHYCTEMATTTEAEWADAVTHACSLLAPGGHLLMSVATELTLWREFVPGEPPHLSADVSIEDAAPALRRAGMDVERSRLELLPAPPGRPYAATLLVSSPRRSA